MEYVTARGLNLKGLYNAKRRLIKRRVLSLKPSAGIFRQVPGVSKNRHSGNDLLYKLCAIT